MSSVSQTPVNGLHGSVPQPNDVQQTRGYGNASQHDFAQEYPEEHANTSTIDRSASTASTAAYREGTPSRSGTLKKKASVSRKTSLKRSGSRRSTVAGSIKGVGHHGTTDDYNSALYTPIPTQGSPTEILANRFQAWRTLLKSLITYFREIQSSYDSRSKAIQKVSNVLSNTQYPSVFITDGGLADATRILEDYHKHSLAESHKSRDIEQDVISALSGLRSDLGQKIKEIKSLSGDFKNSVEKEKEGTRKAVGQLGDALQHADHGDNTKTDPFIVRLGVDRMIEKQIDEENYLHRAYLNLESSGRELEAIVVGEIQKAYNAMASILKREGDDAFNTVEQLRGGPIAMPKDLEWTRFVETDPHFVNPRLPLRRIEDIDYPGKNDPAAAEVRAGMLERKSKYLKSYTPGWYVLSPTHLHEFKSADKIYTQPPVMSLFLADQKLGSHSDAGSSSHKFMLKGRQSGGMHRGHSWVFRAESHETMMAWFEAIKALTEKTGEERNAFVRQHARSISQHSHHRASISSDGLDEDEADQVPYSAQSSVINQPVETSRLQRPVPGGRFPSDLQIPRTATLSPSSESSDPDHNDREVVAAALAMPGTQIVSPGDAQHTRQEESVENARYDDNPYRLEGVPTHVEGAVLDREEKMPVEEPTTPASYQPNPVDRFNQEPVQSAVTHHTAPQNDYVQPTQSTVPQNTYVQPTQTFVLPVQNEAPTRQLQNDAEPSPLEHRASLTPSTKPVRQYSNYGDWMAPAAAGVGAGVLGSEAYHNQQSKDLPHETVLENEPQDLIEEPRGFSEEPRDLTAGVAMPTSTQSASNASAFSTNNGISGITTAHIPSTEPIFVPTYPTSGTVSQNSTTVPYGQDGLSGHERVGAHETGNIFPKVIRHDTDMSVSQLHVPGEFPGGKGERIEPATTATGEFVPPSHWDLARE